MRKLNSGKRLPTTEEVAKALKLKAGFQNLAAQSLGVSASWMSHKINSTPELLELRDNLMEIRLDEAELSLQERIKDKSDVALLFFLKTQARRRGYNQDPLTEENLSAIKVFLDMQKDS